MGIRAAAVVVKSLHASDADGDFGQAFAPGAAESIGNDDRDRKVKRLLQLTTDLRGGTVRIVGEQERVAASVYVGDVHGAVGADKTVASFGDQDAALAPHDAAALPDGQFDRSSIKVIAFRPAARRGGGFDFIEVYKLTFGLGNDFVFDDEDVALAQFLMFESAEKECGNGIARLNIGS